MEELLTELSPDNVDCLRALVFHREEIIDQMSGNFPGFIQNPCITAGIDFKFTGFHFHINQNILEENSEHPIILKFDKRRYVLQFFVKKTDGFSCINLESNSKFTVQNSKLFIEACYQFLADIYPARFGGRKVKTVMAIISVWEWFMPKIMKDEVSGSI